MSNHEALLVQSKELVVTAQTIVAHSRMAKARATTLVANARDLVRRSQDAADMRHANRLAFVSARD